MTLSVCALTFWIILQHVDDLHVTYRWATRSAEYKSELRNQRTLGRDDFRHVEWDGWGFAGQDTSVFLVYDPQDKLALPAARGAHHAHGIPCNFWRIRELESHYYSIVFSTQTYWNYCG